MVPLAKSLVDQARETLRQVRSPMVRRALGAELGAVWSAFGRAHWLWHASQGGQLSLGCCLEHWARRRPDACAIADENGSLSYAELLRSVDAGAALLQDLGVERGTRVAIVAENSVALVVALFATERAGGVALLVDPRGSSEVRGEVLDNFDPTLILAENTGAAAPATAASPAAAPPRRVVQLSEFAKAHESRTRQGDDHRSHTSNEHRSHASHERCLHANAEHRPLAGPERRSHSSAGRRCGARAARRSRVGSQPFAVLATSGTTGSPKLIRVSTARAVISGFGMAGFCLALTRNDSIFCVLSLSHATALLTALCPAIVAGCTLVMRRRFTPDAFWLDVVASRATCLLYVGELARALLCAPSRPEEAEHRLKLAYGNGLSLDIWQRFQTRFRLARVLEYYGTTELPLALVNLAGEPGFMGRTVLGPLSLWRVVARDADSGELLRGSTGACVDARAGQPGELLLMKRPIFAADVSRACAATDEHMREVTHVVSAGDAAIRTGDIVVRDADGYVKFEDRTFEIFRQQGHNVSTRRLAEALERCHGVSSAGVTHLRLEHYDGQLALAVVVPTRDFDLAVLAQCCEKLPPFERPRFLRVTQVLQRNRSLKFDHALYRRQGVNPDSADEPTFVYRRGNFEAMTREIWAQVASGGFRFT